MDELVVTIILCALHPTQHIEMRSKIEQTNNNDKMKILSSFYKQKMHTF